MDVLQIMKGWYDTYQTVSKYLKITREDQEDIPDMTQIRELGFVTICRVKILPGSGICSRDFVPISTFFTHWEPRYFFVAMAIPFLVIFSARSMQISPL